MGPDPTSTCPGLAPNGAGMSPKKWGRVRVRVSKFKTRPGPGRVTSPVDTRPVSPTFSGERTKVRRNYYFRNGSVINFILGTCFVQVLKVGTDMMPVYKRCLIYACLAVFFKMDREKGDGWMKEEREDAATTLLSRFFRKALLNIFGSDDDDTLGDCYYILAPLLQERSLQVVKILSENHWTTSCVITMNKFQDICLGSKEEALAVLGYLSANGRATLLTIKRADDVIIEGVKVSLAPAAVSSASTTDHSVLHLIWTAEKLEKQLHLIDRRYQNARNLALASLKSENKRAALRYAKELKLASLSRERCTALLDRVEKVLQVIADAESSKKVSEAIQRGAHAIQENQISVEEVELCLQEVDENIDSLKRLDNVLESTTAYAEIHDEDLEDEFDKLLLEIKRETSQLPTGTRFDSSAGEVSEKTDALSNALSNLNLKDGADVDSEAECCIKPIDNQSVLEERILEAA
ncbi:hypothetical protein BUALT_Bualt02G0249500 [Buddleja alternifolia]|uniref:Charged multivesicular body protein 7 n=1 Tax=Buddleja alternifolia TaxID=168488 RepID=A0AAV6YDW9_9LAMI|nr:hypothetical protein BUALT_Bualt02G0249500 [Buddleja alternifolia]